MVLFTFMLPVFVLATAAVFFLLLMAVMIATAKRTPVVFTVLAALAGVGAAVGAFALRAAFRRVQGWQRAQSRASKTTTTSASSSEAAESTVAAPALAAAEAAPRQRTYRPENASQYADDARRLVTEIKDALKTSPLPPEQKAALLAQVRTAPESTSRALKKISRLRGLRDVARHSPPSEGVLATLREIDELEAQLMDELVHVRSTLLSISVSLVRVDVARGDRSLDRMVSELSQTNQRLSDLADGYSSLPVEQAFS